MRIVVKISVDDLGYRAWCPSLPGCAVRGQTSEEARHKIEDAIEGYLASLDVPASQHQVAEQVVAA